MKKKTLLCIMILILLVYFLSTVTALTTTLLSPSSVTLCNSYANNSSFTVTGIVNNNNEILLNVTAALIIGSGSSGFIVSPAIISLGNINAFSSPGIEPTWNVQCNQPKAGNYIAYVRYEDAAGFLDTSMIEANSTIIVPPPDTIPPYVQSHAPTGILFTPYATMEVTTNEEAVCRYDFNKNIPYQSMAWPFAITGGRTHTRTMQNMQDKFYSYYVKCQDAAGNAAVDDYKISFTINIPPTGTISLDKPSPLNAGAVMVTLITSKAVEPTPILSYSLDGGSQVSVPLTGTGTSWTGYMILAHSGENKVGSFTFSAKDLTGNTGTVITSGNVFLVDTLPPGMPTMLAAAEQKGGSIRLQWRSPAEEDLDHFNIYKLTEEEPLFALYDTIGETSFTDFSVTVGKTYGYAISAADTAGNEGELSSEITLAMEGISLPGQSSSEYSTAILQNGTTNSAITATNTGMFSPAKIDSSLQNIETVLDEMSTIRTRFKEYTGTQVLLSALDRTKEDKVALLKIKEELNSLKESGNSQEAALLFEKMNQEIAMIQSRAVKNISFQPQKTIALAAEKEQIQIILQKVLKQKEITKSESETGAYLAEIGEAGTALTITTTVQELTLTFLDGKEKNVLLVHKNIASSTKIDDAIIVESIPKDVASSTEELYLDSRAEIIDKDPLIQYSFPGSGAFEYSYIIKHSTKMQDIARTATLVFPRFQNFAAQKEGNYLTGFSVSSLSGVTTKVTAALTRSWYTIGIAVGVLVVVVLVLYVVFYTNDGNFIEKKMFFRKKTCCWRKKQTRKKTGKDCIPCHLRRK